MMARSDGRIEPGQKISTAFSARAWNRAQDAADIVLGQQTKFGVNESPPSPLRTVAVAIAKSVVNSAFATAPSGVSLGIGHAVDLQTATPTLLTVVAEGKRDGMKVTDEEDLPTVSTQTPALRLSSLHFGFADSFGVISAINDMGPTSGDYVLTVIVAGVFRCTVYSFGTGARVSGAFPIPSDSGFFESTFPKGLWRPFPVVSPAGVGQLIATGSYYQLDASSDWPRLYEAVIRL